MSLCVGDRLVCRSGPDLHTRRSPTQSVYQRLYLYNYLSWWWAWRCSKHVDSWNKHIYIYIYIYIKERICASSWSFTGIDVAEDCYWSGAFTKRLWKATVSFIAFVRPHVILWLPPPSGEFSWNFTLETFTKFCREIQSFVKIERKIKDNLYEYISTFTSLIWWSRCSVWATSKGWRNWRYKHNN